MAAERTPSIIPLTRLVLQMALRQQRLWRETGVGDLPVWVNLATRCLRWEGLSEAVAQELAATEVMPGRLVLEVTESSFIDLERAESRIRALRQLGVRIALDDFGTGYSSLGRLRALPIDVLKIDRGFVTEVARDERDRALVRTMVALGEDLQLTSTAEGVETRDQLNALQAAGCAWAQGHLFARPMPPRDLAAWLGAWADRRRIGPQQDLLMAGRMAAGRPDPNARD